MTTNQGDHPAKAAVPEPAPATTGVTDATTPPTARRPRLASRRRPITPRDREQLGDEILHEVNGLGPIEPLMHDPEISDILVNNAREVYIERHGRLELTSDRKSTRLNSSHRT